MQFRSFLRAKIHRATVTEANVHYIGSITIDEDLMDAAGIREFEHVLVADLENGERLETYVIRGARGSGVIGLNGAAAVNIAVGHKVIILCFAQVTEDEIPRLTPRVVFVDNHNRITEVAKSETEHTRRT